jgi:hypothetical protein
MNEASDLHALQGQLNEYLAQIDKLLKERDYWKRVAANALLDRERKEEL